MEQEFALLYLMPGMTDTGLEQRKRSERVWLLKRLAQQKKDEVAAMRAPTGGRKLPR
jgi:hypothetical protein